MGQVMSDKKQEANVIFAIHFDDVNDPRYKEITKLLMAADMWRNNNLVYCEALDSRDALVNYKGVSNDE